MRELLELVVYQDGRCLILFPTALLATPNTSQQQLTTTSLGAL